MPPLCAWPISALLQVRAAELAAVQRMEAAEKRKFEEKERRLAQARAHAAAECALRKKVAAATFARSYLQGEGACQPPQAGLLAVRCLAPQRRGLQRGKWHNRRQVVIQLQGRPSLCVSVPKDLSPSATQVLQA